MPLRSCDAISNLIGPRGVLIPIPPPREKPDPDLFKSFPGFTKTSYSENFKNNLPLLYDWTIKRIPMARWAESREICNSINFLLTSQSSYITGQKLTVDGGWLANS